MTTALTVLLWIAVIFGSLWLAGIVISILAILFLD